jgi:hypothetical protein
MTSYNQNFEKINLWKISMQTVKSCDNGQIISKPLLKYCLGYCKREKSSWLFFEVLQSLSWNYVCVSKVLCEGVRKLKYYGQLLIFFSQDYLPIEVHSKS